jgi:hypothetical protein
MESQFWGHPVPLLDSSTRNMNHTPDCSDRQKRVNFDRRPLNSHEPLLSISRQVPLKSENYWQITLPVTIYIQFLRIDRRTNISVSLGSTDSFMDRVLRNKIYKIYVSCEGSPNRVEMSCLQKD